MGMTKLSQLAPFAPKMRLGVGYEFLERQDGFPGLVENLWPAFRRRPERDGLGPALSRAGRTTGGHRRRDPTPTASSRLSAWWFLKTTSTTSRPTMPCRSSARRRCRNSPGCNPPLNTSAAASNRGHASHELRRRWREEGRGGCGKGFPATARSVGRSKRGRRCLHGQQ